MIVLGTNLPQGTDRKYVQATLGVQLSRFSRFIHSEGVDILVETPAFIPSKNRRALAENYGKLCKVTFTSLGVCSTTPEKLTEQTKQQNQQTAKIMAQELEHRDSEWQKEEKIWRKIILTFQLIPAALLKGAGMVGPALSGLSATIVGHVSELGKLDEVAEGVSVLLRKAGVHAPLAGPLIGSKFPVESAFAATLESIKNSMVVVGQIFSIADFAKSSLNACEAREAMWVAAEQFNDVRVSLDVHKQLMGMLGKASVQGNFQFATELQAVAGKLFLAIRAQCNALVLHTQDRVTKCQAEKMFITSAWVGGLAHLAANGMLAPSPLTLLPIAGKLLAEHETDYQVFLWKKLQVAFTALQGELSAVEDELRSLNFECEPNNGQGVQKLLFTYEDKVASAERTLVDLLLNAGWWESRREHFQAVFQEFKEMFQICKNAFLSFIDQVAQTVRDLPGTIRQAIADFWAWCRSFFG